ncbi:hypothetical protein V8E55_003254 [Tylopilus felleus]
MTSGGGRNQPGAGPGPRNRQVKDAESGAAYLEKTLLSLVGHSFTIEHLATVLLHITQLNGVPLLAVEAIRAVAFLLEREAITRIAEAVATQIKTELSKEVASHVITAISPHVVNFLNANKLLNNCIGSLDALHTSAANNLNATAELALNPPASQPPQKSYSNAVCSLGSPLPTLPAPATAALARAAIRERQILIDPHKGHILHSPKQTTASIAEKLKAILDEIKNLDEATPALIIKAITRLRNSIPADIKDRSYIVLVPFLLISLPLDDPQWLQTVEMENNLREGSLASVRWIKQKARCAPNQHIAHAIFTFSEPRAANTLL